jgi:hypothetical protein
MDESAAITMIVEHLEGLFPKRCPRCQRTFPTLREFYQATTPVGKPVSYDLESGDLKPARPLGAVAVSECPCGAAIALTSEGMPLFRYWSLLLWANSEAIRRGQSTTKFLLSLRKLVREKVVAPAEPLPAVRGAEALGRPAQPAE